MTNKEFFAEVLKEEAPKFRTAIEALPEDKHSNKVHEKSREAGNITALPFTFFMESLDGPKKRCVGSITGKPSNSFNATKNWKKIGG